MTYLLRAGGRQPATRKAHLPRYSGGVLSGSWCGRPWGFTHPTPGGLVVCRDCVHRRDTQDPELVDTVLVDRAAAGDASWRVLSRAELREAIVRLVSSGCCDGLLAVRLGYSSRKTAGKVRQRFGVPAAVPAARRAA